ncbi:MAG TPA: MFS transporter [Candidatus Limnocylindrales bacterium]|nr:MFS transporter [Candidatus Limnocylindrales bacterium]
MDALRTYRELLRNGPLARLLIGEFVSSIGDWLYLVALVVLVYQETQDPIMLGIVGAARMLPYIFLSIPAGIITDRFDRRYVLLVSDLARGACMLVLAALVASHGPLWLITAVAMLAASFSTFFYPAIGALIPSLVRDEREFGPANSAWATLDNFAWIVGPGIAGLLLATGDLVLAFVLNAVTFLVIAVILWSLPASKATAAPQPDEPRADVEGSAAGGRFADLAAAGIKLGAVAGVTLVSSVTWFVFGGVGILIVVIATDVFNGGDAATGYLNGAIGIGGTIGALLAGALVLRPRLGMPLLLGAVAFGIATLSLGLANSLAAAFIAIIVVSIGNLMTDVTGTTIFQRAVPDQYRGRFGGLMMTGQVVAETAGTLAVPILVTLFGFGPTFAVLGVGAVAATLVAVRLIGAAADLAPSPHDADLKRIARLPLFGGLSPARIETALRRLDPVDAVAGQVIVRQGEVADRFYVICGGTFRVTQTDGTGGERVLRTLGEDDVFGERGLIARSPRTATVTAETDGRLFSMSGEDFLELIGGQAGVRERLMALYDTPAETFSRA